MAINTILLSAQILHSHYIFLFKRLSAIFSIFDKSETMCYLLMGMQVNYLNYPDLKILVRVTLQQTEKQKASSVHRQMRNSSWHNRS